MKKHSDIEPVFDKTNKIMLCVCTALFFVMCGVYYIESNINSVDWADSFIQVALPQQRVTTKISINSASENELIDIPQIGPVLAKRIIEYRNLHGQFEKLEDIMGVKGINQKTFFKMKNYITL